MQLTKRSLITSWVFQVIAAVILGQTLFFKFTGAPESVYIFQTVGLEPFGRYASGVAELIAVILLLTPGLAAVGAIISLGVMAGAIGSHLFTPLGISVLDDGGTLFALAIITFVSSAAVLYLRRFQIPVTGAWLSKRCEKGSACCADK